VTEPVDPLGARAGGARPPWSAFRAELEAAGFRPTKTLGQNFLVDSNAARSLAADAALAPGEEVLEIGAGCGFLTVHLAELGHPVLAVEIDARLLAIAQRLVAGYRNVRWLHADALAGKHALAPELLAALPAGGAWSVVANLPYSISAPLLVLLARLAAPPRRMSVLVQDELARRIAARPGEPEWGALSARLQLRYCAALGRGVGEQLFWPRPRVASRVVALERLPGSGPEPARVAAFDALVDVLFQQRRKQVVSVLAAHLGDRATATALLAQASIDPRTRPETLAPEALLALASTRAWRAAAGAPEERREPG
jgi:16S rRNA (adenine1518-N6/adenine1519-N6)-dimethyltransferase